MPTDPTQSSVIVTFSEMNRIFTGAEAVGNLNEVSRRDDLTPPVERAAVMAAMGHILSQLREAEEKAEGAIVMTTPQDARSSRLQSLIASGEKAKLEFQPLATGGLEAKFDTHDWFGWATVAWAKLKHLSPHKMVRPANAVPEPLPNQGRIALLGDWGTGLYGAPKIAQAITRDPDPYALLLHLGDVYYSGSASEVKHRFLEPWPVRTEAVNRALNSNHEMYSGGEAYFEQTLPRFGQQGSYFACQNQNWTLVGLDVAYQDHNIDDQQVEWLRRILAQAGDRQVMLFSHHQLFSHFEDQGNRLWNHPGFGEILRSKRIFAWYWGHEHRCSIFEDKDPTFGLYARCIGHSGMPQSRTQTKGLPRATEPLFARAEWRRSPAVTKEGNPLPSCVVLDGRNDFIPGEEEKFAPHGYAVLTLDGPTLLEQVLDPTRRVIYEKPLVS